VVAAGTRLVEGNIKAKSSLPCISCISIKTLTLTSIQNLTLEKRRAVKYGTYGHAVRYFYTCKQEAFVCFCEAPTATSSV